MFTLNNLKGTAVTAVVDINSSLHRVEGEFEKLLATAHERSWPRIHKVVVAEEQHLDIEHIVPSLPQANPQADLRVVCTGTLTQTIEKLVIDAQTH